MYHKKEGGIRSLTFDDQQAIIRSRYGIDNQIIRDEKRLEAIRYPGKFLTDRSRRLSEIQEKAFETFQEVYNSFSQERNRYKGLDGRYHYYNYPEEFKRKMAQDAADQVFIRELAKLESIYPGTFKGFSVLPSLKELTKHDINTPAVEGYFDPIPEKELKKKMKKEKKKKKEKKSKE